MNTNIYSSKTPDRRKRTGVGIALLLLSLPLAFVSGHGLDSDSDGMPDDWEVLHSLNAATNDAAEDADNDGFSNYKEYVADTDPQSDLSFPLLDLTWDTNSITPILSASTSSERVYRIEYSDDLAAGAWTSLVENVAGGGYKTLGSDTNILPHRFYRMSVGFPALFILPEQLEFGTVNIGETSAVQTIYLTNEDDSAHTLMEIVLLGEHTNDFLLTDLPPTDYVMAPQATVQFNVAFAPTSIGSRNAQVKSHFDNHSTHLYADAHGAGAYHYYVNAGGSDYTDPDGNYWQTDDGFYNTGTAYSTNVTVNGTNMEPLYQDERWDDTNTPEMVYSFPVEPGSYVVRLHFAEIFPGNAEPGSRIFDVLIEGQEALQNYDIVADTGFQTAGVKELFTQVADNSLDIEFVHKVQNPKISAIEVFSGSVFTDTDEISWGHVELNSTGTVEQIELSNTSDSDITIDTLSFLIIQGATHDFTVTIDGIDYTGSDSDIDIPVNIVLAAGETKTIILTYTPTEEIDNDAWLKLSGDFAPVSIRLQGTGGEGTGHPFLHVVIRVPELVVDYDADGFGLVYLDGTDSHTHEFGHELAAFNWSTNGTVFATNQSETASFPLGTHEVSLAIYDDNVPPETLTNSATFTVADGHAVPGSIVYYYEGVAGGGERNTEEMVASVPSNADYAQRADSLLIQASAGTVGDSPYTNQVMIRMLADLNISAMDTYEFAMTGGSTNLLLIDGTAYTNPVMLHMGTYELEARFAVTNIADLPLAVLYGPTNSTLTSIPAALLSHDETGMLPVINSAPTEGINLGGNIIEITGLGFFPEDQVVVHWGSTNISGTNLTVTSELITFTSPPGDGLITVTVETPNGISDSFHYNYTIDGPVPVAFSLETAAIIPVPTQGDWGPDGRFYVGGVDGTITVLSFDDNYQVTNTQTISTLTTNSNPNILGIAFNPFDPPSPVKIYVSHSQLFANGGECFEGFSPYSGAITVLTGPDFDTQETLIDGLPVSNHDHGVNGIQFDNQGRLLVAVGGNSNAGIPDCPMGDLPESPLSAAILRADITRSNFNGHITYVESAGGITNSDQVYGDIVDVASNVDVEVFAAGFRNPLDLVYTTEGLLYTSDNGPNAGYGAASTSATTQGADPDQNDTLNLIIEGNYYGHPNRNRGRYDDRQNVYYDNSAASVPGVFSQGMAIFLPSVNGIDEYRSETFNGALRGELLLQKWNGNTYRISRSADGTAVTSTALIPVAIDALDVVCSPGGAIIGVDYTDNQVVVAQPNDISATGTKAFDIFPWRAPASGGTPFVIGGTGFEALSNTTVSVGASNAVLTYVSSNRIRGIIPAKSNPTSDFLDITVTSGENVSVISNAFRYLPEPGSGTGEWTVLEDLPEPLAEVSAGVINGVLYVVGQGHPGTFAYDFFSGAWITGLQARTYTGNHHAAEVIDGKLYLFGGLEEDLSYVQIYDPETDSWSLGADVPWAGGSASTALIDGQVYLAGGIASNTTVTSNAVYNPATDSWTMLAPMPAGRNHAASATDGERFYIFGGRGPGSGDGNIVAEGFDDVLIYNPATDTWETSFDIGSTIPPLLQKRGGLGKAVYFSGEFYVMGGETTDTGTGAVTGDVYDRVDVYNPVTQTWRQEAGMLTARHGIFPVLHDEAIYLPGGSTAAGGGSESTVFDKLKR
ncbi:malectin domain-containing carbohydrate-binding protein [Tichowtungia aerotolerans]|uniref:Choice-of-anchor D domain-containing protein n=1 Tax=Tichowtungia aerotolerans TaxID=2697043 RepID=A0A6P1M9G2_9BACT|nr:malectin domain-containing carbohydrate-binding protein [Tichowtungia aerotolerans]QHI70672.1 choice-of-anchor D domain-containing protein [Tichowtungia aerotolerans]